MAVNREWGEKSCFVFEFVISSFFRALYLLVTVTESHRPTLKAVSGSYLASAMKWPQTLSLAVLSFEIIYSGCLTHYMFKVLCVLCEHDPNPKSHPQPCRSCGCSGSSWAGGSRLQLGFTSVCPCCWLSSQDNSLADKVRMSSLFSQCELGVFVTSSAQPFYHITLC